MPFPSIAIVRRTARARIVLDLSKYALVAATLTSGAAHAVPITYTETFTTTGNLGSARFSDALVTLTLTGDTADVTSPEAGVSINPGAMTIRVDGSFATFTDQMVAVADRVDPRVGFSDATRDLALAFAPSSAVASYDLRTAIGPVIGMGNGLYERDFPTTEGILSSDSPGGAPVIVTFSAAVEGTTASVPEPSELWLLVAGVLGFGLITRHKARSRGGPRAPKSMMTGGDALGYA